MLKRMGAVIARTCQPCAATRDSKGVGAANAAKLAVASTQLETPLEESESSLADVIIRMPSAPLEHEEAEAERPPAHSTHTTYTSEPLEMPLSPAPIDIEPPPLAPLELAQTEPPPPAASATPAPIETGQAEAERPTARLTHTNFTSEPLEMPLSPAPLKIAQAESTQPTADFTHAVTSTPLELEHKAETPIETPMVESGSSLTDVITRMSSAPLEQEAEAERPPAHSAHTNVTPTPLEVETPLPPEPLELAEMETPLVQGYQPLSPEPLELAEMETPPVQGVEEQILRSASALPPLPLDTVTPEQGGSGDRVLDGGETPQPPADSTQNTATPAPIEHEATKLVLRSASAQRRVLKAVVGPKASPV
ncbi:hypothetical protein T492DRAFT_340283 [Pavlovales sp. CCMP2436]|nr:hypothetical protein T492DRAFT_340283 [Pavlovales sp. CCMP2436]